MTASQPFPIILHVRVPDILRGRDHQRYLERKLGEFGLKLVPPPTLGDSGIPAGYRLLSTFTGGWNVVEVRGEVDAGVSLLTLMQHELVEEAMNAALEEKLRALRSLRRVDEVRTATVDSDGDENITAGGPMPHPLFMYAILFASYLVMPLTLFLRCLRVVRRWYVREIS
jgi:hypothetical protein